MTLGQLFYERSINAKPNTHSLLESLISVNLTNIFEEDLKMPFDFIVQYKCILKEVILANIYCIYKTMNE